MDNKRQKHTSKAVALTQIQRYCAFQDRCHQEVRAKLLSMGLRGPELEDIMASLITDRFLDEERFARSFARGKFNVKQWGRVRIVAELKFRNISAYCIEQALAEISPEAYAAQLAGLLQKKAAQTPDFQAHDFQARQKIAAFALRKGYESDLVWEAIEQLR